MSDEVKVGEDKATTETDKATEEFNERLDGILAEVREARGKREANAFKGDGRYGFLAEAQKFLKFEHDRSRYLSNRQSYVEAIVELVLAIESYDGSGGC